MKSLGLLLIVFSMFSVSCKNVVKKPQISFANESQIIFVKQGNIYHAVYPFKNTGTDSLKVFSAQSDCSCTATKVPEKQIAPGDSGTISATFKSNMDLPGPFVRSIVIKTNCQPIFYTLHLKGTILKP